MSKNHSGPVELKKGDLLFDDGAASDAMYVVKSGCIAIVKRKGNSEIELAQIMPGQLFGEMAFFDGKPRSAGARALKDSTVIALPFNALHAQFKNFPEWLKAMVRTVNDNLRKTNKRLKELERPVNDEGFKFPPHTVTKLSAILMLVANKYGEKDANNGLEIPYSVLRRYTIQIFQEPTHKMDKLIEWFTELKIMKEEKLSEGRKKLILFKPELLTEFVEFYNDYLFASDDKKISIVRREIPIMKALLFYGKEAPGNNPKAVKVKIDEIRKRSVTDLDYLVEMSEYESLIAKGICTEKLQEKEGISITFNMEEVNRILPFWEIIFKIEDKDGQKPSAEEEAAAEASAEQDSKSDAS